MGNGNSDNGWSCWRLFVRLLGKSNTPLAEKAAPLPRQVPYIHARRPFVCTWPLHVGVYSGRGHLASPCWRLLRARCTGDRSSFRTCRACLVRFRPVSAFMPGTFVMIETQMATWRCERIT